MHDQNNIIVIVVSIVALMVLMSSFIFVFIIRYRQKQNEFEKEKQQIKLEQEKALAQVELEISEDLLKNISHEIHDNIGHSLSIAKLTLHGLNAENISEKSQLTLDIITQSIADLRNLSKSMNGAFIRKIGLHAALEREVELINATGQLMCTYSTTVDESRISETNEIILYRCIQETVNNSIKHAKAKFLRIESHIANNHLSISVSDDGEGFDVYQQSLNGIGLASLKERVRLMQGKLILASTKGIGTTTTFEIPITIDQN